ILGGLSYYRLSQTDLNGHKTLLGIRVVNRNMLDFSVRLYPNPASGSNPVHLLLNTPSESDQVWVVIQDLNGREIWANTAITSKGINDIQLSEGTAGLAKGLYLITATSAQTVYKQKLLIQ
ncbi:MAG TPA: T9SS type A sorting domain-containing protein, partial [Bacteroidia bacterium]|nr:T9SS type A sorting domain-containing protein [Bacteroidia bacterium]